MWIVNMCKYKILCLVNLIQDSVYKVSQFYLDEWLIVVMLFWYEGLYFFKILYCRQGQIMWGWNLYISGIILCQRLG